MSIKTALSPQKPTTPAGGLDTSPPAATPPPSNIAVTVQPRGFTPPAPGAKAIAQRAHGRDGGDFSALRTPPAQVQLESLLRTGDLNGVRAFLAKNGGSLDLDRPDAEGFSPLARAVQAQLDANHAFFDAMSSAKPGDPAVVAKQAACDDAARAVQLLVNAGATRVEAPDETMPASAHIPGAFAILPSGRVHSPLKDIALPPKDLTKT
jgi:hypothetical protein